MAFSLGPSGDGGIGVSLIGNYFGTREEFDELVNGLVSQFPEGTSVDADEFADWTQVLVANAFGEALVTEGASPVSESLDSSDCACTNELFFDSLIHSLQR